jgi:hypothetical protein
MALDNFIPAIWSRSLLENLRENLVFGQPIVVNNDYQGEISGAGSSVRIHNIGSVSVTDYTKNTDLTAPETLTDGETILNIDRSRAFNMQIDDIDAAQQQPKVMEAAMREAAYALAKDLDLYLAETAADDGTPAFDESKVPTSTTAYEYLADLYTLHDEANTPPQGRVAIVPPWFHGLLRKDDRFVSYGTDQNRAVLGNAVIGEAAGFNVLVSNNVYESDGVWSIVSAHPMAWTMAMQVEKVEGYRPPLRFADAVKGLNVYGVKVVRPDNLIVMQAERPSEDPITS